MTQRLRARRLLSEHGWLDDHQLRIEAGTIVAIEPIPSGVTARDAELLCPAYIDTHVHGGAGVDVMDETPDALDRLAMHKAREGVGGFLATTVTAPLNAIHGALERIARLLGIDNQLGSLRPGKRANVIALNAGLHLQQIWIQGLALPL